MGERVYVEGLEPRPIGPDVWVRQTGRELYIEILDRESGMRVVTVIELVSPSNKYAGPGRDKYVAKQQEVLQSDSNLVEIDLLRFGPHVLAVPEARVGAGLVMTTWSRSTEPPLDGTGSRSTPARCVNRCRGSESPWQAAIAAQLQQLVEPFKI